MRGRDKYGRGRDKWPFHTFSTVWCPSVTERSDKKISGRQTTHHWTHDSASVGTPNAETMQPWRYKHLSSSGSTFVRAPSGIACSHSPFCNRCALSHVDLTSAESGSKFPARRRKNALFDHKFARNLRKINAPSAQKMTTPAEEINGRFKNFSRVRKNARKR